MPSTPPASLMPQATGLEQVADALDDLSTLGHVAKLRRLAEQAMSAEDLLDTIESAATSSTDNDLDLVLADLIDHRILLARLAELGELATEIENFNRAVRTVRRYREELQWAIEELEAEQFAEEDDM